jgi:hypothetical protein
MAEKRGPRVTLAFRGSLFAAAWCSAPKTSRPTRERRIQRIATVRRIALIPNALQASIVPKAHSFDFIVVSDAVFDNTPARPLPREVFVRIVAFIARKKF